jgi:hypothetical protein
MKELVKERSIKLKEPNNIAAGSNLFYHASRHTR